MKVQNGWHICAGHEVYTENGYIIMVRFSNGSYGIPYTPSKYGGWDNAKGELTLDAFRARVARETVLIG